MADMVNIGGLEANLVLNTSKLDAGIANAERALFVIREDIRKLDAALAKGEISIQDYAREILYLSESENKLNVAMMTASNAVQQQANSLNNAGKSAKNAYEAMARSQAAGMAIMQLGFIIDDIQYGFGSVVNNIGPFAHQVSTAFGASATAAMGWAAGIQVAAVAAYQLYVHWDQAMDALGMGKVRTEAEEMEELAKKTGKTADETARLNKYKREQAEIQAIMGSQTRAEREQAGSVRDVLTEAGGDTVIGKLAQAIQAGGQGAKMTPEEKAELDRIQTQGYFQTDPAQQAKSKAAYQAKLDQINKRINDADIERAQKLAAQAVNDPSARKSMIAKLSRVPGNEELVANLAATLPENKSKLEGQQLEADLNAESRENYNKYLDSVKEKDRKKAQEEMDFDANAENVFKQSVRESKDLIPGGDKIAQFATMQAMLGGNPADLQAVKEQIKAQLKAQGINEGVASAATDEMFKDADKKTKEDVINEMLNGGGEGNKEKATRSQQFNAMELASRVQQGIGNDEPKKQTGLMKEMVKHLANIEKARNGGIFTD